MPIGKMTSYYGKRKRGYTGGSYGKRPYVRTVSVPRTPISTAPQSSSKINKVFQGTFQVSMATGSLVGSKGFVPIAVLPEVHRNVINAFGQVKMAYTVCEVLNAVGIAGDNSYLLSGGSLGFALADGRAVPASPSDVVAVLPNCRTTPWNTLEYTSGKLKIMYKPVTDAEKSWMSVATFFEANRSFFDTVVCNLGGETFLSADEVVNVTVRYSMKLECMMA